ncbi:MAG: DUF5060 domain-containing protein [Verrucomicrobiae bacterium]|nr:DUF5060 domain-containing protein [Verrucomicrobiae bacterium]
MEIVSKLGQICIVRGLSILFVLYGWSGFIFAGAATPFKTEQKLGINSVVVLASNVVIYERVEFVVNLTATYANPFDPNDISVDAEVNLPNNEKVKVPGFYYQDFTRELENGREKLTAKSAGEWRVRFAPWFVGEYTAVIHARDRNGSVKSEPIYFKATESKKDGLIRISKRDRRFFEFESGKSFYPLGANTCWAGSKGTFDYDEWFKKFAENGCNFGRLWLSPHWTTFALERPGKPEEGKGLGMLDLANAWRLDYVLQLAEKNGIFLKLCIDSYNILRKKDAYPEWERTPHNIKNGGILSEPAEFWTNPGMEQIYKNKLRYLVARYGAYQNLFAWEFWNEVDITTDFNRDVARDWHQKMAKFLKEIDPYKHLVTTSFANSQGEPVIDLLAELDYVQTHHYGSPDLVLTIDKYHKLKSAYGKPHYVGEIGADAGGPRSKDDPEGYQVHDPLWISIALACAGSAQSWWWDNLIHPNNLYHIYKPAAEFIKGIDFPSENFKSVNCNVYWQKTPIPLHRYDLVLEGGPVSWGDSEYNKPRTVVINRNGIVSGAPVSGILHGIGNHPTKHNPVTFETSFPWETILEIEVGGVSGYGGATLEVILNNKRVLEHDFADTDNSTETITKYAGTYKVIIPAGKNKILVQNRGKDWVMVGYKFKNAVEKNPPPLLVRGMSGNKTTILWLRCEEDSWQRICAKKQAPQSVEPTYLIIEQFQPGNYQVEFWDTWGKQDAGKTTIEVKQNRECKILLPEIKHDLAVKIIRAQ